MADREKRCRSCGAAMPEKASFCLSCGAPQSPRPAPEAKRAFPWRLLSALVLPALLVCALIFGVRALTGGTEEAPSAAAEAQSEPSGTKIDETGLAGADGTLRHAGLSVRLQNDLTSETGNYFAYTEKSFQTFRVIRCELYSSGGALRVRGEATAVTPAETDDKIGLWFFAEGQNQYTEPLLKKTVTVIRAGVNEGVTVSFDLEAASWDSLAASGKTDLVLFLADL